MTKDYVLKVTDFFCLIIQGQIFKTIEIPKAIEMVLEEDKQNF